MVQAPRVMASSSVKTVRRTCSFMFVHVSAVEHSGIGTLQEGQKLSYELERNHQCRFRPLVSSQTSRSSPKKVGPISVGENQPPHRMPQPTRDLSPQPAGYPDKVAKSPPASEIKPLAPLPGGTYNGAGTRPHGSLFLGVPMTGASE